MKIPNQSSGVMRRVSQAAREITSARSFPSFQYAPVKEPKLFDPLSSGLKCVQATSSGSFSCKDAGNFDSTCATAKCPAGYTLTGGGGSCSAGNRKIKSLFPRFAAGEFGITCEQQGVDPKAHAICCKL